MNLEQAKSCDDWQLASSILIDVMTDLNNKSQSLWSENQLSVSDLKRQYSISELYLAKTNDIIEGIIFLQQHDPYFWPELNKVDSLFLHKLAIHPNFQGQGKGEKIIALAEREARQRGLKWLRLDCDDREPLHRFYTANAFQLVDINQMDSYRVARYEKLIHNGPETLS